MNKQESQNQVSIIINGVRYDAVEAECSYPCESCDLIDICQKEHNICCALGVSMYDCFKGSDKKFEE